MHVLYSASIAPEIDSIVEVSEEGDAESARLRCRVILSTAPGTPPLPADVGVVSVVNIPPEEIGSRLFKTLHGHYLQLQAAFVRSGAHKLPGSKGRLRELAVSDFLASWMPKRYSALTNTFLSHESAGLLNNEIDLVLYDSHDGPQWSLDAENSNWVIAWKHVKAVIEIKSTLDSSEWEKASRSMQDVKGFADQASEACPPRILFAYQIDEVFNEDLQSKLQSTQPFDLIVILQGAAIASTDDINLISAFELGLSPEQAQNDVRAANASVNQFISFSSDRYRTIAAKSVDALMALVFWCTNACAGSDMTQSLLSALGKEGEIQPLFPKEEPA